jgi:F-type H+-transporting ATPase subunit epsilon
MNNLFPIKIITPSAIILDSSAEMVNIPGEEGMFGVLKSHTNFISSINIGIVSVFRENQESKYFVYEGVAQVADGILNILSEFAVDISAESRTHVMDNISVLENDMSDLEKDSLESYILAYKIKKYQALLKFI